MLKNRITLLFLIFNYVLFSQIVINELDCDTPGTDTKEFIELKTDTAYFVLDGYVVVLFNGSASGGNSSYYSIDLDGYTTDINGLLLIGSIDVSPIPQLIIPTSIIQNGADAVAVYLGSSYDFLDGTLATTNNLIDALMYDTDDADDTDLMALLNVTVQTNENLNGNKTTESIQRNNDGTYFVGTPTPRQLNDGTGIVLNGVSFSTLQTQYDEGTSFVISFETEENVSSDLNLNIELNNGNFNSADFTGNTSITIPAGQNSAITTIYLTDDSEDEGDEVLLIILADLPSDYLILNNNIEIRVVDNDFQIAAWGTPLNPTFGEVVSTQPTNYYSSLEGLSSVDLRQALQDIIAEENVVREHTYTDIIEILKQADQNPENSNEVWLVYTEQGRAKLDYQTTSNNFGKWNREHTFPRSRGGFNSIEQDDNADGIDVYWETNADSLRHANSDAHALRAVDGPENSSRGNQHYGQYNGPTGNLGSFKGDVARSVLFLTVRYNGLEIVNGFPDITGQLGDLETLLNWHRNDPPDDFEMNRNNIIYNWQKNRNPFIDLPELVEYIWGNNVGDNWMNPASITDDYLSNILIYPNPTKGIINFKGINKPTRIELFSLDGKLLQKQLLYSNSYIISNLEKGVYFITFTLEDKTISKKIIID